jgi:hypothetical protein
MQPTIGTAIGLIASEPTGGEAQVLQTFCKRSAGATALPIPFGLKKRGSSVSKYDASPLECGGRPTGSLPLFD